MTTSKVGIEYNTFLKGLYLVKFKFEGDNTPIVIQPPCYSASKEETVIDSIYGTNQEKILVSATTLSAAFFSTSIVKDFQDCPDDEEGARSSQEYMNDLEEEYQPRALLAQIYKIHQKGYSKFSSQKQLIKLNATNVAEKGHFTRDCFLKTSVPSYQSPFQTKLLHSSEHKPELKHIKDFKAKYTKFKAKLALSFQYFSSTHP
ncbi:hypothetical protein Tco_0884709 [Tanacetum coccineum]